MAVVVVTLKVKGTGDCIELPLSVHAWGCEKLAMFSYDKWKERYH